MSSNNLQNFNLLNSNLQVILAQTIEDKTVTEENQTSYSVQIMYANKYLYFQRSGENILDMI